MAFQYADKRFSKMGRGVPQVALLNDDGTPQIEDGKPVIGNEQFTAKQVLESSIKDTPLDDFVAEGLEACGGSESRFKEVWVAGFNHDLRLQAGGSNPLEKIARQMVKVTGCSYEQALTIVSGLKK